MDEKKIYAIEVTDREDGIWGYTVLGIEQVKSEFEVSLSEKAKSFSYEEV